jgi:hypothetical protein
MTTVTVTNFTLPHYINGDGTLTTANTGHLAGVALSATTLLIQR